MADTADTDTAPVRELPSFVGAADSGDGTLSVRVDEILYGSPPAVMRPHERPAHRL